ncbi:bifunctional acetyl transferase/isomerase [Treponema primitia ZAS-2]|uniref:Bifunctional acetyl transferase/isomerase n=1 Tax=Treponema primitia (strain ATCC BAA-887 / DSM 12427 / ZAS-2) TaxID=545694 RepID=F5YN50_TREPZ|nr:FdtA/QdtA family cupin domain-containing protein [Treponema primitia]AEF84827.1 bifunctional acetyl transferase/isomerase [Treponema primitia ZAS-2]
MTNITTVYDCSIIELPINHREKGNLTVVENEKEVPFNVQRIYYLYDIPGGESRGGHAHKELRQLIVAASGSFDVILNDGNIKRVFTLNRSYQGLLVVPGIWRELDSFSSGSVCLVLASHAYDEMDYLRDYESFLKWRANLNLKKI